MLLLLIPLAALLVKGSFTDCNSAFPVQFLTADPPRIVAQNQTVHFEIAAHFPEAIQNGTIETSISLNFIPVFEGTDNLCHQFNCPIQAGNQLLNKTFIFPHDIWGRVSMRFELMDQYRRPFLCIDYNVYASGTPTNESRWF
jgi:hypothetical protein